MKIDLPSMERKGGAAMIEEKIKMEKYERKVFRMFEHV